MFTQKPERSYQITLTDQTDPNVVQWFEELSAGGRLADELTAMVYKVLKDSGKITPAPNEQPVRAASGHESGFNEGSFFDSLYNWQESNTKIFKDEGGPANQIQKKKMLSV